MARWFIAFGVVAALALGVTAANAACPPCPPRAECKPCNERPPAEDLAALIGDYVKYSRAQDPIRAATRGDRDAARRWPDDSMAAVASRKAALEGFRARLETLAHAPLSDDDVLNRDILVYRVNDALEGFTFDEERVPFLTGEGFYNTPESVALTTIVRNADDAEDWLARLAAIPAYYAVATENMRRGIVTRFTQPKLVVDVAIQDLTGAADAPAAQSTLLLPFRTMPSTIPSKAQAAYRARALAIVAEKLQPAQRALAAFMANEYLPAARAGVGIGSLPNGKSYYAYLARHHTTTSMTPEAIHNLGLSEVARIRREMDKVIAEAGFSGSFAEFLAFLRNDPRFHAASAEDYVQRASEIAKRVDLILPQWIGKLPRLTFGFRDKPPGLENSSGGYWVGSPEQGVAGTVVIEYKHATQLALYELPSWVMHEGVPGHHTQISLAQERYDLPEYRRNDDVTAFVEGWALYTERLGNEMGIYRTPYEKFGQLSMEIWRACRLVIDTGMHFMGWTRDQARACLLENSALPPHRVDQEVDRYIGWPGQALAYKVGELKIVALRARAEAQLGPRFDIKRFHDFILDDGPMPLDLLERRVGSWIEAIRGPERGSGRMPLIILNICHSALDARGNPA